MIALTDAQLQLIQHYAAPLPPPDRSAYLHRLVDLLAAHDATELGEGELARIAQQAQKELRRSSSRRRRW